MRIGSSVPVSTGPEWCFFDRRRMQAREPGRVFDVEERQARPSLVARACTVRTKKAGDTWPVAALGPVSESRLKHEDYFAEIVLDDRAQRAIVPVRGLCKMPR